jgi:hypothetical protein
MGVFMFRKLLLTVLTLAITCAAQDTMQQLKKNVAFVYGKGHVKGPDGNPVLLDGPLGTAFFVFYPDPRGGEDYGFVYIVTAKHVLKDELEGKYLREIRVRMNTKTGADVVFASLDVSDTGEDLKWFDDKEDPNADIALRLALPDVTKVDYTTIPLSLFADADFLKKSNVSEGDQVYLVGLMPQFTGEHHNYPVVRHGYIALLSDEPIPLGPQVKEKLYALELGSWPGQSGSPVFLNLGGARRGGLMIGDSYSLLGLMLAFVPNERPFDTVAPTANVWFGDPSNIGISYVLPAAEIVKVLNSKEAQQQRDADIQAKSRPTSAR